jgi:hypothetical protein
VAAAAEEEEEAEEEEKQERHQQERQQQHEWQERHCELCGLPGVHMMRGGGMCCIDALLADDMHTVDSYCQFYTDCEDKSRHEAQDCCCTTAGTKQTQLHGVHHAAVHAQLRMWPYHSL